MIDLIKDKQKVFIVGIKGVAMTNLALIMKQMGHEVKGSDVDEEFITDKVLEANDIEITNTFENTAVLEGSTLLIYAAGHRGKMNPQVQYAMNNGITVIHQIELLGEILKLFPNSIAVSGCHGKTTTSSLIAYALEKVATDPSYMIGVPNFNEFSGGKYGSSDYMVVEADEYGISPPDDLTPKFLKLLPKYLLITNIDFDHPDVFRSIEETKDAFMRLIKIVLEGSTESKIIVCIDDENLEAILQKFPRNKFVTYGWKEGADFRAVSVDSSELDTKYSFEYFSSSEKSKKTVNSTLEIFGEKNVSNAIGAIATLASLGFDPQKIADSMTGFKGAKRRFEMKNHIRARDIFLFDDYAHHPTEIKATINATRLRFNDRRLFVIFQPHTFSRTRTFKNEFVDALSLADFAIILPVFKSAREKLDDGADGNSQELANIAKQNNFNNIKVVDDKESVVKFLSENIKNRDIIFTMGAGDVYKIDVDIVRALDN